MTEKLSLNHDGCAFGQVTRERVDNLADAITGLKGLLTLFLMAGFVQLFAFAVAAFWFVANLAAKP